MFRLYRDVRKEFKRRLAHPRRWTVTHDVVKNGQQWRLVDVYTWGLFSIYEETGEAILTRIHHDGEEILAITSYGACGNDDILNGLKSLRDAWR